MIDPHLQDWWSRRRLTEIRYHDGCASGAGIPLRVILPACLVSELVWFSISYGEYDDNLLLLGCDKDTTILVKAVEHRETSPVRAAYDGPFPDEYVLTEQVCSALGFRFEGNGYSIAQEERVRCQIYIHDDCFFYIKPVQEPLLGRLLNCILEQHSFYLGREIDWSAVSSAIEGHLVTYGRVELQSDYRRQCLWVPQLEKTRGHFWKWFRKGTVLVEGGKARLRSPA